MVQEPSPLVRELDCVLRIPGSMLTGAWHSSDSWHLRGEVLGPRDFLQTLRLRP